MVLQDAHRVFLPKRGSNFPSFLLSQSDPPVVIVDALLPVKVTGIYPIVSRWKAPSPEKIRALPCVSISTGLPNALHVFPWML